MKILIVAPGLHLGGTRRFTSWLCSRLAQLGHTVILGVRSDPKFDHYSVDPQVVVVRLAVLGRASRFNGEAHRGLRTNA